MSDVVVVQFAASASIEGNTLNGIAHAVGEMALTGSHYETFSKGAFNDALMVSDPRAFVEHDRTKLLGRFSTGTLRLSVEEQGGRQVLRYSIDLPNTSYANDLRELVLRGDLNESSFGFVPDKFTWTRAADGLQVRTHTRVRELVDVSPVAMPAFAGTNVELHSKHFGESRNSQLVRARARARQGVL